MTTLHSNADNHGSGLLDDLDDMDRLDIIDSLPPVKSPRYGAAHVTGDHVLGGRHGRPAEEGPTVCLRCSMHPCVCRSIPACPTCGNRPCCNGSAWPCGDAA